MTYQQTYQHKVTPLKLMAIIIIVLIVGLLSVVAYGFHLYNRPIPTLNATTIIPASVKPDTASVIAWPAYGESAVGIVGRGLLASSLSTDKQTPLPTASVAKLMTALAILDKKPLAGGESGPMITITQADVDIYNSYVAKDGSVSKVQLGEQISEYDALEALLLPSANNIADSAVIWAFGSVETYAAYANDFAKQHAMAHSTFADASGFSPSTVSTANDLLQLGLLAKANPVISEIAAKSTADIPVAGTIYNVNGLLGKHGINGLKTGNTDEAGGVFVTSADRQIDGQQVTLVATVVHGPDLETTMRASVPLLDATAANLEQKTLVKVGQSFGIYTIPWQKDASGRPIQVKAIATKDVSTFIWKGDSIKTKVSLNKLSAPQSAGFNIGNATVTVNDQPFNIPLTLQQTVIKPGLSWRLNR